MSNSTLVTYRHIVRHRDSGRGKHRIQKIFVHHMAGVLTVKQCGNVFDNRPASAHYGVSGTAIGQYVDEKDTAWHCGNFSWNQKSIGIELANDSGAKGNWHVSDTTINTAIKLIADICRRNGIPKLVYTGDMNGNLCMHRWVCSTSCPGPYLATQFRRIEKGVNDILGKETGPIKLDVDGIGGPMTVSRMQEFLGTQVDGVISGQNKDLAKYYPALESVIFDDTESTCVKALQWMVGVYEDGVIGQDTTKAWQKFLGVKIDGIFGPESMKAWQKYLNEHDKAIFPETHAPKPEPPKPAVTPDKTPTIVDKILAACKTQSDWMKNSKYEWESKPTVAKSKKKGTCVTYVACVLQRVGLLKSGQHIWHNGKGYGTGKVYGTNSKMTVMYMGNKTLTSLKDKLKAGDIVMVDDNKSGKEGSGGHIFIVTGKWTNAGNPYIWDNETAHKSQKARAYSGKRKVLAIVRPK